MGYVLFFVAWLLVCLPALIYAGIIEGRRRRDATALERKIAALQHDFELLDRRFLSLAAASTATQAAVTPTTDVQTVAPIRPTAASHTAPQAYAPLTAPKPAAASGVERPVAPQPKIAETGGMSLTSRFPPPEAKPATPTPPPPPPPPS